jgi:hypothetical protein
MKPFCPEFARFELFSAFECLPRAFFAMNLAAFVAGFICQDRSSNISRLRRFASRSHHRSIPRAASKIDI